jgi:hypothetical protein
MIRRKLIAGGGDSLTEAIRNITNDGIEFVATKDNTLYVISNLKSASEYDVMKTEANEEDNTSRFEKFLFSDYKNLPGGVITFSTDVNSKMLSDNVFKNWILQKFKTYKNRFSFSSMLDKIRIKNNVYAWTIGKYMVGVYTGKNNKTFNENSISISMIGVSRSQLFSVAEEICKEFNQESVLVQDNQSNQIYFVEYEK